MGHNNNNIRELQSGSVVKSSTSFLAWLNLLPAKENYSPAPIWAYANSRTEKIALTGIPVCISIFLGNNCGMILVPVEYLVVIDVSFGKRPL